ncbi:hypothetical protein LINPERPRIM_LOCUS30238, partial [Linum perenne]
SKGLPENEFRARILSPLSPHHLLLSSSSPSPPFLPSFFVSFLSTTIAPYSIADLLNLIIGFVPFFDLILQGFVADAESSCLNTL